MGTPITVEVKGSAGDSCSIRWVLLYDNNFTGWISSVTTGGSATITIPATGSSGAHYRNTAWRVHLPLSEYAAEPRTGSAALGIAV